MDSNAGIAKGKGWTLAQKHMASLITRKTSATSPASPAVAAAQAPESFARSPLELNLSGTPAPHFWPTVTSCPNSAITTNPASAAEPFTPVTPMHSAIMHTTPRALFDAAGSADTPIAPDHASTEEMRAYGSDSVGVRIRASVDQLLATAEKSTAAPQRSEESMLSVSYPDAPPSTPAGTPAHIARVTFADTIGRSIGSPRPGARAGLRKFSGSAGGRVTAGPSASPITQSPASPASRSPYSTYLGLGPSAGASPPRDMWIDTTSREVQDCDASTMYLSTSLDLTPRSKRMLLSTSTSASTPASAGAPQSVESTSSASTVNAGGTGGAKAKYRDTPRPKTKPKAVYKGSGESNMLCL